VNVWLQDEKRQKDRQWRGEELEQCRRNLELDEVEEAQFQAYARDVIQHCEQRGRNTYPLRRAAAVVSQQVIDIRAVLINELWDPSGICYATGGTVEELYIQLWDPVGGLGL